MLLIARAKAQQLKFIALDEATSKLDKGNQLRVMKMAQLAYVLASISHALFR